MKIKEFLIRFAIVFVLAFVSNAIVVYLWNMLRHGQGDFDWGTSLTLAIVLGIVLPVTLAMASKKK